MIDGEELRGLHVENSRDLLKKVQPDVDLATFDPAGSRYLTGSKVQPEVPDPECLRKISLRQLCLEILCRFLPEDLSREVADRLYIKHATFADNLKKMLGKILPGDLAGEVMAHLSPKIKNRPGGIRPILICKKWSPVLRGWGCCLPHNLSFRRDHETFPASLYRPRLPYPFRFQRPGRRAP